MLIFLPLQDRVPPTIYNAMTILVISLITASILGVIASVLLGPAGMLSSAWVDVVVWSAIGAGAALAVINIRWECVPCRISRLAQTRLLTERLCRSESC